MLYKQEMQDSCQNAASPFKYSKNKLIRRYTEYDKNTFYLPRNHSRNTEHKWLKRGRTGQITAVGAVGYYGFTTIGDVNIKSVENDIFLENEIKNSW